MLKNIRPRKRNQENPNKDPKISKDIFSIIRSYPSQIAQRVLFCLATCVEFHLINENVSYMGHGGYAKRYGISIRSMDEPFYILVELGILIRDYRQFQTNIYRLNSNFFNYGFVQQLLPYMKRSKRKLLDAMKKDFYSLWQRIISNLSFCRQVSNTLPDISSQFGAGFNPWMNLELFAYLQTPEADPFGPEPPWWEFNYYP